MEDRETKPSMCKYVEVAGFVFQVNTPLQRADLRSALLHAGVEKAPIFLLEGAERIMTGQFIYASRLERAM